MTCGLTVGRALNWHRLACPVAGAFELRLQSRPQLPARAALACSPLSWCLAIAQRAHGRIGFVFVISCLAQI